MGGNRGKTLRGRRGEVGITISVLTYYPDTGVLVLVKSEHFDPASEPERPALPVSFRRGLVRGVSGCSE